MAKKKQSEKLKLWTKHLHKSVPTPTAQTTTMSQEVNPMFADKIKIASDYLADPKNYIIDKIVIQLLLTNGLRISEVLNITNSDIATDGSILIHSKKGSNIRYVSAGRFSDWIGKNPIYFCSQLKNFNRFYYYRLFKKIGLAQVLGNNRNASVTHLFRYAFIDKINSMTKNINDTALIVGHKNSKNTLRYEKKANSKNK